MTSNDFFSVFNGLAFEEIGEILDTRFKLVKQKECLTEGQRRLFINEYPRNEHNIMRTVEDLYRGSMDRAKNIPDTTERNFWMLEPFAESST